MTEISFYHLTRQPLTEALPRLLERVLASNLRAVILCGSKAEAEMLDDLLWCYTATSFMPHGCNDPASAASQPIYLTVGQENPNQATVLVVTDGALPGHINQFDRCLDMFDGSNDAALESARNRWRHYRDTGQKLTYWQQTTGGSWEKKQG